MKGVMIMFDKKYKKALKIIDEKINFNQKMFDFTLHQYDDIERTDEEKIRDLSDRHGQFGTVDKYIAKLEALCELKRELREEIGV